MMKVGMYNRWLATLGGGEKHSLAVAEFLSRDCEVKVMSHQEVSKEAASSRLKLDLSRVEFCPIPECTAEELGKISGRFDLFINASFMSIFPVHAPMNICLVYFPYPVKKDPLQRFRRKMGFFLKQFFMIPTFENSLFQIKVHGKSYLFKINVLTTLLLPGSRIPYSIRFLLAAGHPALRGASFYLNERQIQSIALKKPGDYVLVKISVPAWRHPTPLKLTIQGEGDQSRSDLQLRHLVLSDLNIGHPHYRLFSRLLLKGTRGTLPRLYHMKPEPQSLLSIISTYQQIWANSKFTQKWIKKYWGRESEILYPPVDVEDFVPQAKRRRILNVGRFFAAGHNKKHLEMISAFKAMVNGGLKGWELHLSGGTAPEFVHQEYLNQVTLQAQGYPIVIHPDIPFPELVELYGGSAIYWHASGYRENEDREPHKFEHFGITTVEAMAAGCVPVVIGKGGQPEIVRHGENGFLWQSLRELRSLTWELINDKTLRRKLMLKAVKDSRRFNRAHFNDTLKRLLLSAKMTGS